LSVGSGLSPDGSVPGATGRGGGRSRGWPLPRRRDHPDRHHEPPARTDAVHENV